MIDELAMARADAPAAGLPPPETLEQRVHRLEEAVAALQETEIIEERIAERVVDRMQRRPAPESTGIVETDRRARPPVGPSLSPGSDVQANSQTVSQLSARKPWLIVEVFRELRVMFRMFFDTRYRVSWSAFFALMILAYILVSQWLWALWSGVPLLGWLTLPMHLTFLGEILDKAVDLLLALFAYKTLSREMRRYREAISSPV
jgi:hypothetical protein